MKNIQIIDGAENCEYAIYQISDEVFNLIFPNNQNVEFINDLVARLNEQDRTFVFKNIWISKVIKSQADGIHGTLFYQLELKKKYYPNKKELDVFLYKEWLDAS